MPRKILLGLCLWLYTSLLFAQQTFPLTEVQDERKTLYALKNATIWIDYQTRLDKATLLLRNGVIEGVGNVAIPKEAVVLDLQGRHIYPAFIDLDSDYGMPEVKASRGGRSPQTESNKKGPYNWNQAVQPENNAAELFNTNAKKAEELRKLGFGAVLSHSHDGLIRGTGALLSLHDAREHLVILKDKASSHLSFNNGSSAQYYPNSIMGRVALIRQTYLDADWYKKYQGADKENNLSLEAFIQQQNLPTFFETRNWQNALVADKIGDEFGKQFILMGSGDEYQRLAEVKASNASLVIPVNYPQAYDVEDPYDAFIVSLAELKHWEMAPANAAALAKANINFAFTSAGLKDKKSFWPNVLKAVAQGLDKKAALKAVTFTPAQLLGQENRLGSLKKGMIANFIVTSKDIFEADHILHENWVQGNRYILSDFSLSDIRGTYRLAFGGQSHQLFIEGSADKPSYKIQFAGDTTRSDLKLSRDNQLLTLSFSPKKDGQQVRLSGWIDGKNFKGDGQNVDGSWLKWTATFEKAFEEKSIEKKEEKPESIGKVIYPFVAFGNEEKPKAENLLIRNATVWTNEAEGILQNTDVLVQNGKIVQVGKNLPAGNARVIDGTGKHLTTGIIDEHSHVALSGVNEGSQAVTAEVRMYDAIDSDDINIYRQLAGGVTAAQLLHGSANPIGGQSALVKFKWGENPDAMRIQGAEGYIKFALGENVKQSNWGDSYTSRFPQTRMGVEQVMVDAFTRAQEYEKALKEKGRIVRRDLELEALVEILNAKRFITCHSYVQSEINMLIKVAERFGFKVNTFTHILEGYKLADLMAKHGSGGSTFADWWAYKYEVKDAIPYNAAMMSRQGVTVAINSDDAEMARRLNQEAAKAIKYGGVSEEEAWKMVTLNPAKLLHLDKRMGSIKTGKDADLVLWTDNPLSIYAKPDKTIIEGTVYFDLERDAQQRKAIEAERARLLQKMLAAKAGGAGAQKPQPKKQKINHCEDIDHIDHLHEEE